MKTLTVAEIIADIKVQVASNMNISIMPNGEAIPAELFNASISYSWFKEVHGIRKDILEQAYMYNVNIVLAPVGLKVIGTLNIVQSLKGEYLSHNPEGELVIVNCEREYVDISDEEIRILKLGQELSHSKLLHPRECLI